MTRPSSSDASSIAASAEGARGAAEADELVLWLRVRMLSLKSPASIVNSARQCRAARSSRARTRPTIGSAGGSGSELDTGQVLAAAGVDFDDVALDDEE